MKIVAISKFFLVFVLAGVLPWTQTACTHSASMLTVQETVMSRSISEDPIDAPPPSGQANRSPSPSLETSSSYAGSRSMPAPPFQKTKETPRIKAKRLFELARRENRKLEWDDCLAAKAVQRARRMVQDDYFEHKDSRTGKNPAWALVASCLEPAYAGENLSKEQGKSAAAIHKALMSSPTHRKNILNPRYDLIGVGCYESICVELFAGF